jgi:hypothetical protein
VRCVDCTRIPEWEHQVSLVVWRMAVLSDQFDGKGKDVTDTTPGSYDARRTRVVLELAPEPKDQHVDAEIEHVFVSPSRLQEMLTSERSLWCIEERSQKCVLAFRQCDRVVARTRQASRGRSSFQPSHRQRPRSTPCCVAMRLVSLSLRSSRYFMIMCCIDEVVAGHDHARRSCNRSTCAVDTLIRRVRWVPTADPICLYAH